jgi:hypothetical protein
MNGSDCIAQYRSYINYRDGEPARRALAAEAREEARLVRERKAEEVRGRKEVKDDIDSEDEGDNLFADHEIEDISANGRQVVV